MKKTYIHPNTEVIVVETAGMMAASLYDGELGAPLHDMLNDGGTPDVFMEDNSGSLFDADVTIGIDDDIVDL